MEPDLAKLMDESEQIPKAFRDMAGRDQEFTAAHGTPMREDIQNARRIIRDGPGWVERLRAALSPGGVFYLLAALAALGLGAAGQEGDAHIADGRIIEVAHLRQFCPAVRRHPVRIAVYRVFEHHGDLLWFKAHCHHEAASR